MHRSYYLLLTLIFGTLLYCTSPESDIYRHIPSLDDMPGEWVSADTADMEPSIRNFMGQALTNRDITSVSWFASAPFTGGYHTGRLHINSEIPEVTAFRWQAWQALREAETAGLHLKSSTRMPIGDHGILWEVEITNTTGERLERELKLDLIGFNASYEGPWQWWYPYPTLDGVRTNRDDEVENVRTFFNAGINEIDTIKTVLVEGKPRQQRVKVSWPTDDEILRSNRYQTIIDNGTVMIREKETDTYTSFRIQDSGWRYQRYNSGASAFKTLNLEPGESYVLRYVMLVGSDQEYLREASLQYTRSFEMEFKEIESHWKQRWQEIFRPDNSLISAAFPVLATDDSLAKRVYYTGPLTMLYLTHLNLPQHDKVFLTGGPRWGASITFFWDITEWSLLWATVDPEMMKTHLISWITIDPSKHYGMDNISGKGVGNGYSANYWALFQMIRNYVVVSGDQAFLEEEVEGKTIIEHLTTYATNWQKISIYGQPGADSELYKLADFGDDEWNLLEAVPTYKHIVPSFNAAYVWMMMETARFHEQLGNMEKAAELEAEVDPMMDRILQLYAGDGVWNSLYPNNKRVEVRHSLDFMFLGRYTPDQIPDSIKSEMLEFVFDELITDHWMRAQSQLDIAAEDSDRPDHGPLGAFDGWPAGTMDALTQLGYTNRAYEFYKDIAVVTKEGIWAQAHELWGENKNQKNARVRIAQRGWHNRESSSGIAMSQVMMKNFFGFYPQIGGETIINQPPEEFTGTLYNVQFQGKYYMLNTRNGKTKMIPQ